MYITAKEFCRSTGFPSRTLTRLLREGKLDFHRAGRRYILDEEQTIARLRYLAHEKENAPISYRKRSVRRNWGKKEGDIFDGTKDYHQRILLLKKAVSEDQ